MLKVALFFVFFYCKGACKKRQTLEEPGVNYHISTRYDIASNNLTEVTPLPPLSLTGHSEQLTTPSYKNPLLTSAHRNHPKKDSVITIPSFAISSPINSKNVSVKGFATSTPKK